jgi:hypothetical protein
VERARRARVSILAAQPTARTLENSPTLFGFYEAKITSPAAYSDNPHQDRPNH